MTADRTEAADRVEPTVGGLIYLANLLEHGPTPLALKAVAQSLRDCAATLDDDRANSIARIRLDDEMEDDLIDLLTTFEHTNYADTASAIVAYLQDKAL